MKCKICHIGLRLLNTKHIIGCLCHTLQNKTDNSDWKTSHCHHHSHWLCFSWSWLRIWLNRLQSSQLITSACPQIKTTWAFLCQLAQILNWNSSETKREADFKEQINIKDSYLDAISKDIMQVISLWAGEF